MSSQSEPWSAEERWYQATYPSEDDPARGSNDSELSHETGLPSGIATGLEVRQYNGASVRGDEPAAKRPRKMMIR
jgi:hypothetical protein